MLEQYFSNLSMVIIFIGLALMVVGAIYATVSASIPNNMQDAKTVNQKNEAVLFSCWYNHCWCPAIARHITQLGENDENHYQKIIHPFR